MPANPRRVIRNLLFFTVPFIFIITGVMYFAYTQAIEIVTEQYSSLKLNLAARIADNVGERFRLLERELRNLADHLEENRLDIKLYERLVHRHTLKYTNVYDADILIANQAGAIYFYRKLDPYQKLTHIPEKLFQQLRKLSRDQILTFIHPPDADSLNGTPRIFVAIPLFDNEHRFGGAIAFSIRAEKLLGDLIDTNVSDSEISVLGPGQTLVYPYNEAGKQLARELAYKDSSDLSRNAAEKEEHVKVYRNQAGVEKIAVCQKIDVPGGATWVLTFSTPRARVTQTIMPFIKRFRVAVALVHLFVFGSLLLAIYYTYRWNLHVNQTNQRLEKEIEQRKLAQDTIDQQNAFFENVIESIPHPFYVVDAKDYSIKLANSAASRGQYFPGVTCYQLLHGVEEPCNCNEHPCPIHNIRETGHSAVVEHVHFDKTGQPQNVEVHGYPILDKDGKLSAMIVYAQDVTERRQTEKRVEQALREKEVLIGEIHHRVKNNLQVMYGLLEIQADFVEKKSYQEVFKNLQNQIMSMALVHEKLYQGDDLANIDVREYFRRLADVLFMSYGVSNGQILIELNITPVKLSVDTAILCGLIMNELVSNCLKHAFPEGRSGKIMISLQPAEDDRFLLIVSDDGVGLPESVDISDSETFGLQMVQMLIEGRIEGRLECVRENGTTFRIWFRDPGLTARQTTKMSDKLNPST